MGMLQLTPGAETETNYQAVRQTDWAPQTIIQFDSAPMEMIGYSSVLKVWWASTATPLQKLHVLDGNILISRSHSDELGSANGTIYFGDVVDPIQPFGKWGIEYVSSEREGYGLNFWKPWVEGQNPGNFFLFLADNGKVGIGTNNPTAKLSVNGDILAKSIRISINPIYWPDYVFGEDYELMSLTELEAYVKTNKHLPGVSSIEEVERQGNIDLGEMNTLLLEKVEELTRYIFDLQKQIDEMRIQNEGKEVKR